MQPEPLAPLKFDRHFFTDFWRLAKPYWTSEEKWSAWFFLILNIVCVVGEVQASVGYNRFHKLFYNALQNFDKPGIIAALEYLLCVCACLLIVLVTFNYVNNILCLRWRRWLTQHYLHSWLKDNNHYHLQQTHSDLDNPDQRISEDLEKFPRQTLSLFLGPYKLLHSLLTVMTFGYVLWDLSAFFIMHIGAWQGVIPGYVFWIALLYSALGTWLMAFLGKKLTLLDYHQQRHTANFRFSLVRMRESSEQVALHGGEAHEQNHFTQLFNRIVGNARRSLFLKLRLTVFQKTYGYISYIIGFVVSLPYYLTKTIALGTVMQISSAYNSVQGAFSTFVECFTDLAEWRAVIHRLAEFTRAIERQEQNRALSIYIQHADKSLQVEHLKIKWPHAEIQSKEINFTLLPGQSALITGASGSGKSTLLRALAGLWLHGAGTVTFPQNAKTVFLPQKPYLPQGSLRELIGYPDQIDIDDDQLFKILACCHLTKFIPQLDKAMDWKHILSGGEQQLIAFARLLVSKPDVVFLDEATSAMDESMERALYEALKSQNPQLILVSVGHRLSLQQFHEIRMSLNKPIIVQEKILNAESI